MSYGSLNINAGTYSGGGVYQTGGGTSQKGGFNQVVTSSRMNQMTRNTSSGFASDLELIQKYLEDGKTDKAIKMYANLHDDVKQANSYNNMSLTDAQVDSIMKNAYEASTGTSLIETIDKHTSNSFVTGFKQAIPIVGLFVNDTSEAEALAQLTGDKVSFKDKALEFLGIAAGTVAFAGLGFLGIAGKLGKIASIAKPAKVVGGLVGAGAVATGAVETFV